MRKTKPNFSEKAKWDAEETLRIAKAQEREKRHKSVRIDARTIISVPVGTNPRLAAERFRTNVNKWAERHG